MTSTSPTIAPVHKEVVVHASAAHAFKVFTEGVDLWWPRSHHIGKSPLARAVLEPRPDGRWYSVSEDGTECDTGRVLVWEPPRRLVLSWQITANWQFDPNFMTEVEVTFTPQGDKRTLVAVEHRNLERYGPAADAVRASIGSDDGWGKIMRQFAEVASADGEAA